MKKFIIIFCLSYGNIPSYIFTNPIGKKDYHSHTNPTETDTDMPAIFGNGIHAISVDHKDVADAIKENIVKFSKAGYGDIGVEIVTSFEESKLWEGILSSKQAVKPPAEKVAEASEKPDKNKKE